MLEQIHPGKNFRRQSDLLKELESISRELRDPNEFDVWIASANGTFVDAAEKTIARKYFPEAKVFTPKASLGESVAAGPFWQLICAAQALAKQELPPVLHSPADFGLTSLRRSDGISWRRAVVTACGLNQQVAACIIRL